MNKETMQIKVTTNAGKLSEAFRRWNEGNRSTPEKYMTPAQVASCQVGELSDLQTAELLGYLK